MAYLTSGRDKIMGSSVSTDANVVTIIDENCTDEQVPSALATKAYVDSKYDLVESYSKDEVDNLLNDKANTSDIIDAYTKGEVDNLLDAKANANDIIDSYTKDEVNDLLDTKVNVDDLVESYSKDEMDTLLADKANTSDTYNKTEIDALLDGKANTDDVTTNAYTKEEVDDLLANKADSSSIVDAYTKGEVDNLLTAKADATALDNYVLSDELDDYALTSSVYNKTEVDDLLTAKVDTTSVVTTLSSTNVDEEIPSAKAVYDAIQNVSAGVPADVYSKTEIDNLLDAKADTDAIIDAYNKTEVDDLLADKANATDIIDAYTKDEVDNLLTNKADTDDIIDAYTKDEVNTLLDDKANSTDIVDAYTKTEVDGLLADKVNVSSVVLTLSSANTDEEIPSAKAVYTYVDNKEVKISAEEDNKIEIKDDGIFIGKDYVEITQAEYDLLTEEEKKDIVFYITDTNINDNNNTTNIVTIIDENCTDEQVPSAKAVYNALENVSTGVPIDVYSKTDVDNLLANKADTNDIIDSYTKTEVNDLLDDKVDISSLESMCLHSYHVNSINGTGTDNLLGLTQKTLSHIKTTTSQLSSIMILFDSSLDSTNFFGLPNGNFAIVWIKTSSDKDMIIAQEPNTSSFYICTNINSQTWRKPLMTSIQDESLTTVSLSSTEFCTGSIQYEVKNGICYLYMRLDGTGVSTNQAFKVFATGVPKPSANHFVVINDMNDTGFSCTLAISTTSDIGFACNSTTAGRYYGNFSYPVAE